jgi:trehalose-phosphatase
LTSLFAPGAWDKVAAAFAPNGSRPLLAFDVDGTLAPIVTDPARARVPVATRRLLTALVSDRGLVVAAVSARRDRDLRAILPVRGIRRVAQYGLEGVVAPPARERARWRHAARNIRRILEPVAAATPGAWVEDKGMTVSLHDRLVPPGRMPALRRALRSAAVKAEGFGFSTARGLRVTDFVPRGYDKGRAIEALRRSVGGDPAIYFGDSEADEPAFAALGRGDVPVRVGPGPTRARYRVRGAGDVARFLRKLLDLRRALDPATRR